MRIFVALDIDDAIRRRIEQFMDGVREFAPDVRWAKPESLHVTLKFIGEQSLDVLDQLQQALSGVEADTFSLSLRGYGFFPTACSARVFWVGIEAGTELKKLAAGIDDACLPLGIGKEDREFSPHLTLARGGSGAPARRKEDRVNRRFAKLQEKLSGFNSPEFGTMIAREFFLYESKISQYGARYSKIEKFDL
jgi:RNA 2',3'-cyclic 3'-phosphodiesterase